MQFTNKLKNGSMKMRGRIPQNESITEWRNDRNGRNGNMISARQWRNEGHGIIKNERTERMKEWSNEK